MNTFTKVTKGTTIIVLLSLFIPVFYHFILKAWVGDFWLHAAAVRQFSLNLWQPSHPFYDLAIADVLLSPYAFSMGFISGVFNFSATTTLAAAAFFNLALYLIAFYRFAVRFFVPSTFFGLALLCTLYLWGKGAWAFSGFYHASTIALVLPYPSAFCQAASLLLLSYFPQQIEKRSHLHLIISLVVHWLVLLSHPLTYLFLLSCSLSLCLTSAQRRYELVAQAILTLTTFSCATFWPFYPFIQLLTSPASKFHFDSISMYENVIQQIWPVLVLAPCCLWWGITNEASRFMIALVILASLYFYGLISEQFIYGREIGNLIFLSQLFIASSITLRAKHFSIKQLRWLSQGIFAFCLISLFAALRDIPSSRNFDDYSTLMSEVQQQDVVLAPLEHSHYLPAFSGKVVATSHPPSFISDSNERLTAIKKFYEQSTSQAERAAIIKQFNVRFVLVDKVAMPAAVSEQLVKIGRLVSKTKDLEMLEVR